MKLIYLLFLARTRIRRRRTRDPKLDDAPNTPPPIKTPSSKIFLSLYADDSDDEPTSTSLPLYVDDESLTTVGRDPASTSISTSHSATVIDKTYLEDEYVVSDIELTDDLIAVLDKTYSEDEYIVSDIELTDELISVLDKTYSPPIFPDLDDIKLNDAIIADKIR